MRRTTKTDTEPGLFQQKDDESISERMRNRRKEVSEKNYEDLTIAEKLTLRAMEQTVTVPFACSQGDIDVEVRLPTLAEYELIANFEGRWEQAVKSGDTEKALALSTDIFRVMADLCVDESLNEEFFRDGAISATDFSQILKEALLEYRSRIKDAKSFRREKSGASAVVHGTR